MPLHAYDRITVSRRRGQSRALIKTATRKSHRRGSKYARTGGKNEGKGEKIDSPGTSDDSGLVVCSYDSNPALAALVLRFTAVKASDAQSSAAACFRVLSRHGAIARGISRARSPISCAPDRRDGKRGKRNRGGCTRAQGDV